MTHTLHRMGSEQSLSEDFVMLMMPSKDINHEGSAPKLRRFFELALENNAIKIGDCRSGNEYHQGGVDKLLDNAANEATTVVHPRIASMDELERLFLCAWDGREVDF